MTPPPAPPDRLPATIERLSARVDALQSVISREERCLAENDADGIATAAEDKRAMLAGLDNAWLELHEDLHHTPGTTPGALVAAAAAHAPGYARDLDALLDRLRECRLRNLALGTVLAERRRLTEQTLDWLTGGALASPAYGPGGSAGPGLDPRFLGQA